MVVIGGNLGSSNIPQSFEIPRFRFRPKQDQFLPLLPFGASDQLIQFPFSLYSDQLSHGTLPLVFC